MFFPPRAAAKKDPLTLLKGAFVIAGLLIASSSAALAQRADKPVDLTVLSTSEENVQFVVTDEIVDETEGATGQEDAAPLTDNLSGNLPDNLPDNFTDNFTDTINDEAAITAADTSAPITQEEGAATGRMTRRSVKDVGLASIGIAADSSNGLDPLDNRLWRGVDLPRALRLINAVPVSISSDALRAMSYHVIARQAVPPKGAAENPSALLLARMDYLSRIGRSQGLADIITQLPQTQEWQSWHMWKLFYDLMMREDEQACARAADEAQTSLDPIWQKTNLLCQILTGDEARAAFSADVLKASGLIDDPLFFDMIAILLRRKSADETTDALLAEAEINLMHLIVMDAAHVNIGAAQLASLDSSYAQAAGYLRYLADDARQSLGMGGVRSGLMSRDEAKAVFIASSDTPDTPLMAMSRRLEANENEADSASVRLYLSLRAAIDSRDEGESRDEGASDELIATLLGAIGHEVRQGNGAIWLPLYAPYLQAAMASTDMRDISPEIQGDYALVMALAGLPLSPLPVDGGAVVSADHASIISQTDDSLDARITSLMRLGLGGLLPLLGADEAGSADQDWLTLYENETAGSASAYQPLSPVGLRAVAEAAERGQRAEAVILAAHLISDTPLSEISPTDHARLAQLLTKSGVPLVASAYMKDAFASHVMVALLRDLGDEAR